MKYAITTLIAPKQHVLAIRERQPVDLVPAFIQRSFSELFSRLGSLGITPMGPPFAMYHEFGPGTVDAEVCVPVPADVEADGKIIRSHDLPDVTVARTLHVGRYEDLGVAYQALTEWIQDNDFTVSGPVRERYLNGPGDAGVVPEGYMTEIEMPITPVAVPV